MLIVNGINNKSQGNRAVFAMATTSEYSSATAVHELGHNLGGNLYTLSPSDGKDCYGYCYKDENDTPVFRTIMATDTDCQDSDFEYYYSNPDVTFDGIPTGELGKYNDARVFNRNAPIMAAYKEQITDASMDVNENEVVSYTVNEDFLTIDDASGDIAYGIMNLPDDATFDAETRAFTWTPPVNTAVSADLPQYFFITFTATDEAAKRAYSLLKITVNKVE